MPIFRRMRWFRRLFCRTWEGNAWSRFAEEIGGDYSLAAHQIRVVVDGWEIVFDTESDSRSYTSSTRIRAPFINKDALQVTINRAHLLTQVAHAHGMTDIKTGDSVFDDAFSVTGNDPEMTRRLLASEELKSLLHDQDHLSLGTVADHDETRKRVEGLDFACGGEMEDRHQLENVLHIFIVMLNRLRELGYADPTPPGSAV